MQLIRVRAPIIAVVALAIILVLWAMALPAINLTIQPSSKVAMAEMMFEVARPAPARTAVPVVIAEGGSFDPKDLCNSFNAVFRAAGVPNICTEVQRVYVRPDLGVVQFMHNDDIMARVDYGVDRSESYMRYKLPGGYKVWQTALRIFKPYTGQGLGQTIVRNYETLLKAVGAHSGDIEIIIASPDKKVMSEAAATAWEDFIIRTCIEWGATPINFISPKAGCWRFIP